MEMQATQIQQHELGEQQYLFIEEQHTEIGKQ